MHLNGHLAKAILMKLPPPHVMKCEVQKRNGKCHRPCCLFVFHQIMLFIECVKFNFIEETKKLKMAIYAHFTL